MVGTRRRYATLTATLWCFAACSDHSSDRVLPDVEEADGIEIATLREVPGPVDPRFERAFHVVREVPTVLAADAEPLLFDPRAVVELPSNNLLAHDPTADRPLVILDPDSRTVITRFGSNGRGPGELSGRLHLAVDRSGEIVVLDVQNRQVSRYTSDGEWEGSTRLDYEGPLYPEAFDPQAGHFVAMAPAPDVAGAWHVTAIDPNQGSLRRLGSLPRPTSGPVPWQRGRVLWTVLDSVLVGMWAWRPSLMVYDHGAVPLREIRLPLSRRTLSEQQIQREVAKHGAIASSLSPGPMGLTNGLYPVSDTIFGMFLSNLWRAAEDPELDEGRVLWRLLTTGGAYVGTVEQPDGFLYLGRGDGTIWARVLDENALPILQELKLND